MAGGRTVRLGAAASLLVAALVPVAGVAGVNPFVSVETRDANLDGRLDRLIVTLRSDPGQVETGRIVVGGYRVTSVSRAGAQLTVGIAQDAAQPGPYDTGVKPDLAYNDGRQWWLFLSSNSAYTDGAAPVLISATGYDAARPNVFIDPPTTTAPGDSLTLRFSEPVTLSLNATQDPRRSATSPPTPAEKHVALEQVVQLNGVTMNGCGKDGDGINGHNFPTPSPDTAGATLNDPIDYGTWPNGARVGATTGDQIIVTAKPGSAPSTPGWMFALRPPTTTTGQPLAKCTFNVAPAYAANITDRAQNPLSTRAAAVTITHIPGLLTAPPVTGDRNANGVIDEIALAFNHPIDAASLTSDALGRLTIADPSNPNVRASNLAVRSVSGALLIVSFTAPSGWTAATTPAVSYASPAGCTETTLRLTTPPGDKLCVAGFSRRALDGTRRR